MKQVAMLGGLTLALLCLSSCVETQRMGEIEVTLSVDLGDDPPFASFSISPSQVTFHVAGMPLAEAWQGKVRPEGAWLALSTLANTIDLVAVARDDERALVLGSLPLGSYDHVFLELDAVGATGNDGHPLETANIVEPIAVAFEIIEGETQRLRLELVVVTDWPGDGQVSVFAKNASAVGL